MIIIIYLLSSRNVSVLNPEVTCNFKCFLQNLCFLLRQFIRVEEMARYTAFFYQLYFVLQTKVSEGFERSLICSTVALLNTFSFSSISSLSMVVVACMLCSSMNILTQSTMNMLPFSLSESIPLCSSPLWVTNLPRSPMGTLCLSPAPSSDKGT